MHRHAVKSLIDEMVRGFNCVQGLIVYPFVRSLPLPFALLLKTLLNRMWGSVFE